MTVVALRGLPQVESAEPASPRAGRRRALIFGALAVCYFSIGYLLIIRFDFFDPDAPSRAANAGFVVESRDPHLSAIGFVWNPLPSLVQVPFLQLSHWWPELRTRGLSAVVQSALFMAGAAVMIDRIAVDRAVPATWRWLGVAAFALHPMIVVYGASGMSEAAEAFFVVWCVRRLMLWSDSRHPGDLAGAGLALGFGYLVRYEMIPAAIGAAIFVGLATACGAGSGRRTRSLADMAIVLFPIVVSAAVWALGGWVVDQELFATVSSRYGNESIVRFTMRDNVPTLPAGSADWVGIAARMLGMQPFVGIAGGAAVIHWALTRKPTPLAPLAVIAPVLVFAAWGQATTTTFGYFRYYLLGVPLVICLALGFWAPPARRPQLRPLGQARRVGAALLCASVVAGFPVTVIASFNERIGNQPLQFGFKSLLFPDHTPGSAQDIGHRRLMVDDRLLADHLDRLELPDGSVLMDTFSGWGVWLSSARPKQFVITSDFDFKAALNRPWEYGVRYIVVGNPELYEADAVTVRYPSLWFDGAGMARPVYAVIGVAGEETLRLYRVTGRPRSPGLP